MKYLVVVMDFNYERRKKGQSQSIFDIIRKHFKAIDKISETETSVYRGKIGFGNSRSDKAIFFSKLPQSKLKEARKRIERDIKSSGIKIERGKIEIYEKKRIKVWNF